MDLVPGAACTSVLLMFPSSLSMSEAVVDIGVVDLEPVKSDNSSCRHRELVYSNLYQRPRGEGLKQIMTSDRTKHIFTTRNNNNTVPVLTGCLCSWNTKLNTNV